MPCPRGGAHSGLGDVLGGSNPALQAGLSHFALAGQPVGAKDNAGWGRATSPMGDKGRTGLR